MSPVQRAVCPFTKAIQLALCPQAGEDLRGFPIALADKRYLDRTGTSILTGPREFAGFRFNAGDLIRTLVSRAWEPPSAQTWRCKIAVTRAQPPQSHAYAALKAGLADRSVRADSTRRLNHNRFSEDPADSANCDNASKKIPAAGVQREIPGAILKTAS
jgi:hypothetical protein